MGLLKFVMTVQAVVLLAYALPMAGGWGVGSLLGYPSTTSLFLGAALTATSVGITARVLSDLGHLHVPDSQVILGAAVADDATSPTSPSR